MELLALKGHYHALVNAQQLNTINEMENENKEESEGLLCEQFFCLFFIKLSYIYTSFVSVVCNCLLHQPPFFKFSSLCLYVIPFRVIYFLPQHFPVGTWRVSYFHYCVDSFFLHVHTIATFCFLCKAPFLDLTYFIHFILPDFMASTVWIFASLHNDNLYIFFILSTTLLFCHTNGV